MQDAKVIEVYEAIRCVTGEMLSAARNGDWDLLIERERACRTLVEWLKTHSEGVSLTPAARVRKVEIVRKLLADDAAIRDLAEPGLARLGSMLQGKRRERDVWAAYNSGD